MLVPNSVIVVTRSASNVTGSVSSSVADIDSVVSASTAMGTVLVLGTPPSVVSTGWMGLLDPYLMVDISSKEK